MIVQWFMTALSAVINAIFSIMPPLPVPGWFLNAGTSLSDLFGAASSMGVWIPVPLALSVMATLFGAMFGGAMIKLGRTIASFLTGGGGSAA